MATVTAQTSAQVAAPTDEVLAALADYREVRPAILTEHYTDYAVQEGGQGDGTVVTWQLHATSKRVRHVVADVSVRGGSVTERDRNSTLVTTFDVSPSGAGSLVEVTTTWVGAGGIGGFFERTFAPKGLGRIHDELLANLAARLGS